MDFYFVNSYAFVPEEKSFEIAKTNYDIDFCSIISKGNIFGAQFHPEKSSKAGRKFWKIFLMLKVRVITTMLWNGTTLVKGNKFNNSRRAGSPITTIKIYNSRDVDEILFFDIVSSGNKKNKIDIDFYKELTDECSVPITIGGGIKKISNIDDLLFAGADKISVNSEIYNNPKLLDEAAKKFGSQTIVVCIDFKKYDNKKYKCVSFSGKKTHIIKSNRLGKGMC